MLKQARLENLPFLIKYIQSEASKMKLSNKDLYSLQLAVEEALVNIIQYAYPKENDGTVEVECLALDNKVIEITIKDKGVPFNPVNYGKVDTLASLENRKVGGLGIFYMKETMDEVSYFRKGKVNILKLKKVCKT